MNTDLEILNERANRLTLFYFPYQLFPNLTDEEKKQLESEQIFGELYLYQKKKQTIIIKNSLSNIELFNKKDILDNNILKLIEIKEKGKDKSFSFILERYISRIKGWEYIHDWLNNNFNNNIVGDQESKKYLFQFQLDTFRTHLEEIQQHFKIQKNIPTESYNNIVFDDVSFLTSKNKTLKKIIDKNSKSNKKKKPKVYVTNEDADQYLLKTVFNIKT